MAEMDAFERRVADTLLRYADEVAPALDAATVARRTALAHPRRHGRAGFLPWQLGAMPRVVWLLLLAGLLVALIGGLLLVGSQQRRLPAVVPPVGHLYECPPGSTPDKPGRVGQARPAAAMTEMAFDRRAGRLVALADTDFGFETWTFDVCTNTWTRMHPNREPPNNSSFGLVYDVDSDVTVAVDWDGRVWAYDLEADTWTEKGHAAVDDAPLRFYDPVSGLVVALGDDGDGDGDTLGLDLWSYEVETDTWAPIPQAKPLAIGPHHEDFAYDASVDRLVAYSSVWKPAGDGNVDFETRTWLFDLRTGTWSETGAVTPRFPGYGYFATRPAFVYDEASQRTVIAGQGRSTAYDATADRWETLYGGPASDDPWDPCASRPECRTGYQMVYDPVNERLVVYGGTDYLPAEPGSMDPDDVLAFDTRTREWTVLLEASEGRAAP